MPIDPCPARLRPIPPMDHGSGDKGTAFTWAMGRLILQRIADGETVKAITADARMPAYCTVFRWMQVVPEFGEAVRRLRAARAAERRRAADAGRAMCGRRRRSGRREQVSAAALDALLTAIREGASMTEAVAAPGAPSFKAVYSRVRKCPGFRAAFVTACRVRDTQLELARYDVIDSIGPGRVRAVDRMLRALDGRRGRVRPKLYRPAP